MHPCATIHSGDKALRRANAIYRLVRILGWTAQRTSAEAVADAMKAMLKELIHA